MYKDGIINIFNFGIITKVIKTGEHPLFKLIALDRKSYKRPILIRHCNMHDDHLTV